MKTLEVELRLCKSDGTILNILIIKISYNDSSKLSKMPTSFMFEIELIEILLD